MRLLGRVLACAVAVSVVSVSSPAAAGSWAQFHRGVSRSGLTRSEALLTKDTVGALRREWSFATGVTEEGINSSPAIKGGVAYIGSDDGRLWAVDARTGDRVWSVNAGSKVRTSPAVGGGRGFFGYEGGGIYSAAAAPGAALW